MTDNGDESAPAPMLAVAGFSAASMWKVTEDSDPDDPTAVSPDGVGFQVLLMDSNGDESTISMYIYAENVSDIIQALVEALRGQRDPGTETVLMVFDGDET